MRRRSTKRTESQLSEFQLSNDYFSESGKLEKHIFSVVEVIENKPNAILLTEEE